MFFSFFVSLFTIFFVDLDLEGLLSGVGALLVVLTSSSYSIVVSECTALVPAGYWDSYYEWYNSNIPRLGTLKSARAFIITPYVYGIIIGVIISDVI